jgi:periplasmic copper chaperone A
MSQLASKYLRGGFAAACAVALGQLVAGAARAADYNVGPIHIGQPWARATPKGASSAASYMTVTNTGTTPDRMTCVSSEAAAHCEIHTMSMEGGVMKMRPVDGGLEIAPGGTVTLKPGGLHMMLVDLKHPLEQGKMAAATLKFEKAGTVDVDFPIAAIGAAAPGLPAGGGTMMMEGGGGSMMKMDKHLGAAFCIGVGMTRRGKRRCNGPIDCLKIHALRLVNTT